MELLTLQANSIQLELTQAFRHVVAALPSLALVSLDGYLGGKASERIPCDWRLFIPCAVADSLLKAISEAARNAASGGVVLVSLARSISDRFQDYQECGQIFCQAAKSIGRGVISDDPNIHGKNRVT